MSDKRMNEIGRRREFRRRLRDGKKAVSPVVATLILILIAVAAAAALYLWLVAWQGGVTSGIGSPSAQYTITIGGSTSVYPWSVVAAKSFEGNNSNIVISVNQGGSGAGMAAVCSGNVDIGASSSPQTYTALTTQYGCPSTVVQETVAYDAVDVITPTANVHGLQSISWDTMQAIYVAGVGGNPVPVQTQTNLESQAAGYVMNGLAAPVTTPASTGYAWDQIPACAPGTANCALGQSDAVNTYAETQGPFTGPFAPATDTLASGTFTSCTTASGNYAVSGTATFAIDTMASATFTYPTITTAGCTTNTPTLTSPGTIALTAATPGVTVGATTLTYAWTANYALGGTAGTGTGTQVINAHSATSAVTQIQPTSAITIGPTAACGTNDLCAVATAGASLNTPGTATSSCGFSVCAGGTGPGTTAGLYGATIHPFQRQDAGGTTQSFTARILGVSSPSTDTTAAVGFTGCQPTGQLSDCGIVEKYLGTGNPGVISGVAADKDAIGYASDGLVIVSGSGVIPIAFQGIGQTVPVAPLVATTIVAGIVAGLGGGTYGTGTYIGWRPFIYVQTAPPTGEVLRYLQWCMQPGNNQEFALAANEISPFQPGLAGHVPVTPVP